MRSIVLFALMSFASVVHAENYALLGAAVRCEADGSAFEVASVATFGEDQPEEDPVLAQALKDKVAPVRPGFTALPADSIVHDYHCEVGTQQVVLRALAFPPQERGQGQGAGGVILHELRVGETAFLTGSTDFNWTPRLDGHSLTKIAVRRNGAGVEVALCESEGWERDAPYANETCTVHALDAGDPALIKLK